MPLYFNKKININNLYFIIYKTQDENYLKLIKEYKYKNLFFDIVLTSKSQKIKYALPNILIEAILPVAKIVLFYQSMKDNNKKFAVLIDNKWHLVNEILYDHLDKYYISKDNIDLFMDMLEMVKNKEIEPIYLPFEDEEKEKSFL